MRQEMGLAAVRCMSCGLVAYPASAGPCLRCTASALEPVTATGDGTIWSYTVQRFAPKSPPYEIPADGFQPFVVAYVETADGIRIEGIVDGADPDQVRIGQLVHLTSTADVPRYRIADDSAGGRND